MKPVPKLALKPSTKPSTNSKTNSKTKPASNLNWSKINHFNKNEFPKGTLDNLSADFITRLDQYRQHLNSPLTPSPVPAGWIRTSGSPNSQHYAVGRLSTAGDVFLSPATAQDARFAFTLACQYFSGVGIYYDTEISGEPRIMLHLDIRDKPTVWCRHKGEYLYPARGGRDADVFYFLLNKGVPQP